MQILICVTDCTPAECSHSFGAICAPCVVVRGVERVNASSTARLLSAITVLALFVHLVLLCVGRKGMYCVLDGPSVQNSVVDKLTTT